MKLPRDLDGRSLAHALRIFEYEVTRQTGRHIRLTSRLKGEHHISIPDHRPLRIGTLAAVLDDVAGHFELTRDALLRRLFD